MSSTGIKTDIYDNLEADIIDVNDSLFIKKINILDFINDLSENLVDLSENLVDLSENLVDLSENLVDLSENVYDKIFDLSGNIINRIFDLSGNIINSIFDLSGNIKNNINDVSGNLNELKNKVTDLSGNVAQIKSSNDLQELKIFEHGLQISANTDALVSLGGILTTTVTTTGTNTAAIGAIILTLGIPSVAGVTPSTGIYASIDSKTSRSLFGSGNIAIYGLGPLEYINLVYNNDHFEDIKLISNHALNLKEPYKSLPTALNNLSDIVNTKQDNLSFTSPLLKDASNNVTIDLSSYPLKINVDTSLNDLQTTKQDNLLFISPLLKDVSNNITIDLSAYPLKINVDASLNDIISTKQENLLFISPLLKDISNNITIDLSAYPLKINVDTSLNDIISTKQENLLFISPLLKDISNNITIDLSAYPLKINVDTSLNDLQNKKQDNLLFTSPLLKDISNNITIDLSAYPLKINVDSSLNNIINTKQDNLFFTSPLSKDISNNISINLSAYPLKINVDTSLNHLQNNKQDNITCLLPLSKDMSNNISINLSDYALKNSLNASNVTSGTLPVSFGGTGTTTLNNNQILIGNGTNALLQSPNLIWDNSSNGLGIGIAQFFNARTSFQVNNRRLWVDSTPNSSISVLSTDKYGTGTTENYIQLIENVGIDFRGNLDGAFNFRFAAQQCMSLNKSGATVKNLTVVQNTTSEDISTNTFKSNDISTNNLKANTATINTNLNVLGELVVNTKLFGANATSKTLIQFQTNLRQSQLYYYNLDVEKYYKTGQNINGKDYKIFNLTSWAEDGFSIINKCTVYTSTEGSGIKYIMFYDNWGGYLPNGNQTGWQQDNNVRYMTFITTSQKNIITILENLL